MNLLPKNHEEGWTPYAWLIYLGFLFFQPLVTSRPIDWAIALAAIALFLPLYFRGYWVHGKALLPVVGGLVALGLVFSTFNSGGAGFFIYASAFVGRIARPRIAVRYLAGILAIVAVYAWLVGIPYLGWAWALALCTLIGGVNIHFAEVSRSNAGLKQAQQEVERLATLAERERIARDLHDVLGHTLSVITLKSELAAKLAEHQPQRAAAEMREVEAISRQALSEVRKTVHGYRHLSLGAELAKAKVALSAAGVQARVEAAPYALDSFVESVASMALREAVTNTVRHANAETCRICFEQRDGEFHLLVADDGRGGKPTEGAGLGGMRERVESVDGRLEIDGAGGMRLSITLPVEAPGARDGAGGDDSAGRLEPGRTVAR